MYYDLNGILFYLSQRNGDKSGTLGMAIKLNIFSASKCFDSYLSELIEDEYVDIVNTKVEEKNQKLNTNFSSFTITKKGQEFIDKGGYMAELRDAG